MQTFKVDPAMAIGERSVHQRSFRYYVALVLASALLFSSLMLSTTAQKQQNFKSLDALLSLLKEADALAKDASVRSELKQASEAALRARKGGEGSKEAAQEMQTVRDLLRRIADDPRGESSGFREKITDALNLAQDNSATGDVAASDKMAGNGTAEARGTTTTQKPEDEISPVVLAAFRRSQKDSSTRAEGRQKAFEADSVRFAKMTDALAEALKAAGVDLDGYLAASKQFVETPPGKTSQGDVDRVNKKFAEPIRAAIAKAVGVPGVGDLLQSVQPGQSAPGVPAPGKQNHRSGSGNSNGGAQAASCCSTARFEPPFEGLYTEGGLGASVIRAGVTRQLDPMVRSAIASAPHELKQSGRSFTVPATSRRVSVTVNLGTRWLINLSGLGYAHVWLGLGMNVSDARGAVVCRAPHLEQDNRWTWAGGDLRFDHRSGLNITRTCEFNRNAGDPTDYAANVSASSDGTFVGFSGGYGYYYVDLGPVDVTICP